MEKDDKNKPSAIDQHDKTNKDIKIGEAPNNPATNNNIPFEEGQFEIEKELPNTENGKEDKVDN